MYRKRADRPYFLLRRAAVMAGNSTRTPGRSVTSKVLSVLDAFSAGTPRLSLNEISRNTGLPLSTTYRLVSELVDWGGLERCEGVGYRIGLRLWEVGSLAPRGEGLRDVALPFMQDLYDATRENVHLAVLDGLEALYVEKITGRRSVAAKSRRGGRLPLHATGVGKVLLAHAPPDLFSAVVEAGLKRYTPHTLVAPGLLHRALEEIRRTGVAHSRDELTVGTVAVAAPVFGAQGKVIAALAVVVRSASADLGRLEPAVRCAASSMSRALREHAVIS
jgi:DNA-binding IclR family transcriptional regulator